MEKCSITIHTAAPVNTWWQNFGKFETSVYLTVCQLLSHFPLPDNEGFLGKGHVRGFPWESIGGQVSEHRGDVSALTINVMDTGSGLRQSAAALCGGGGGGGCLGSWEAHEWPQVLIRWALTQSCHYYPITSSGTASTSLPLTRDALKICFSI